MQTPKGLVVFLTGLSGSGKSTIAQELKEYLTADAVTVLDGDVVREHLSKGLGFSKEDRDTNIKRIGWVAAEIAKHGGTVICAAIAPYEETREVVRQMVEDLGGVFLLVHVATSLEVCEERDIKGLYAKVRAGDIKNFTGISDPYEEPVSPDCVVDTAQEDVHESARNVMVACMKKLIGRMAEGYISD